MLALSVFAMGLLLLFPDSFNFDDSETQSLNDQVLLNYMENVLRKDPENDAMRIRVAARFYQSGNYVEALEYLKSLKNYPTELDANAETIAGELAEYFAHLQPQHSTVWLNRAATAYLGESRPDLAALVYTNALVEARDDRRKIDLFEQAARAWLSADRPEKALSLSQSHLTIALSRPELAQLTYDIGVANGNQDLARSAAYRLSEWAPDDTTILAKLISLELGSGLIDEALSLAQRWHAIEPESRENRRRLAQLYLWVGLPQQALTHVLWLAKNDSEFEITDNMWKLANSLYHYGAASQLLVELNHRRDLSDSELMALVDSYERSGNPQHALEFLRQHAEKYPDRHVSWKRLVDLQDNLELWQASVETWAQIDRNFNVSTNEYIRWAKTLWRVHRPEAALSVLRHRTDANEESSLTYWALRARLEWALEHDNEAFSSYLRVNKLSDEFNAETAERLIQLSHALSEYDTGVRVATRAWQETQKPRYLLQAMDFASRLRAWSRFKVLLDEAQRSRSPYFEESPSFWMFNAAYQDAVGNPALAVQHYQRALSIDPSLKAAKAAMLWLAVDQGDPATIRASTRQLHADAKYDHTLWPPMAAAYLKLGEDRQALFFLYRLVNANPQSTDWLLEYAEVLHRLGYATEASSLRRYALSRLLEQAKRGEPLTLTQWQQSLLLVRSTMGDAPGEAIWAQVVAQLSPQQREQWQRWIPQRIEQLLARGELDAASRWAMRAQQQRLELPIWQQVAIAMMRGDREKLEGLLPKIDSTDLLNQIQVLNSLDRKSEALLLGLENLGVGGDEKMDALLRQQTVSLRRELANGFRFGWSASDLGNLRVSGPGLDLWLSEDQYQFHLEAASQSWRDDGVFDVHGLGRDTELRATGTRVGRVGRDQISLGFSRRDDADLTGFQWRHEHRLTRALTNTWIVTLNDRPDVTPELRLFGEEDSLEVRLDYLLSQRHRFNARGGWYSYDTRQGSTVGSGLKFGLAYDYLFRFQHPTTTFWSRLDWMHNDLSEGFPSELYELTRPGVVDLQTSLLLPRRYQHMATGVRLQHGLPGEGLRNVTSPSWFVDLGVGAQWPERRFDFILSAGQGWRVFGDDELSLSLSYARQTIGSSDPSMSLNVNYSRHLSR